MAESDYFETTIRRLAAGKKVNGEANSLADLAAQAAVAGPIAEIWDTPEEEEAWAHLFGLTHEPAEASAR